jgi:SAM-dependent methyltransferase
MMTAEPEISTALRKHYGTTLAKHGPNAAGTDWRLEENAEIAYVKMMAVLLDRHKGARPSLLDVGCGYGGLLSHAKRVGIALDYSGIDIVPEMVAHGRSFHPEATFFVGDAQTFEFPRRYDYIVCNGVLSLKLKTSILDMNIYAARLIRRIFSIAHTGIAFNVMSNRVNFMVDHAYYRSPVEILAFCLSELSNKCRIDHAYNRFEFTTYVYRDEAITGSE